MAVVVILFAMFCMVTEPTRDDFYYQSIPAGSPKEVLDFLRMLYFNWSSRMVTEPLVLLLVNLLPDDFTLYHKCGGKTRGPALDVPIDRMAQKCYYICINRKKICKYNNNRWCCCW